KSNAPCVAEPIALSSRLRSELATGTWSTLAIKPTIRVVKTNKARYEAPRRLLRPLRHCHQARNPPARKGMSHSAKLKKANRSMRELRGGKATPGSVCHGPINRKDTGLPASADASTRNGMLG